MALPRASAIRSALGRTVLRRASAQSRAQAWRQIGRRNYASEHSTKSSDLPWIIGSVVVTVPASVWLFAQGPEKSDHHAEAAHAEGEADTKDQEEPAEEAEETKSDESAPSTESAKDSEDEKESTKQPKSKKGDDNKEKDSDSDESKEESSSEKSDDSSDEGGDKKESKDKGSSPNAPGQINYKSGEGKGPGEGQKGSRPRTETKGEKDAASNESGAKHPSLDDDEKSKKGNGLKDTEKIHGTVDTSKPAK